MKKTLFWVLSFFIALFFAVFQRLTGPTYPLRGTVELEGEKIKYSLARSCESGGGCGVLKADAPGLSGRVFSRRYRTEDDWAIEPFSCGKDGCGGAIRSQPPAGKTEYYVELDGPAGPARLGSQPVVARFKGPVPGRILIPHIVLMFLFMVFSARIFLTAFTGDIVVKHAVALNLVFLLLGGFVFGPLTQYHAFGQYWTGWPFGKDLTDNKVLFMLPFWLAALYASFRQERPKWWLVAAFAATMLVYFIPHSMFGSELDYSTGKVITGK